MRIINLCKKFTDMPLKKWQWFVLIWSLSLATSYVVAQLFKWSVFSILPQ